MKELFLSRLESWIVCIKLAPSSAGISFMMRLFGIELAYSHSVLLRLFYGLMEINPVFLLMINDKCISLSLVLRWNYSLICIGLQKL